MRKYNISDDELSDDILTKYEFTYHGEREKQLLAQIIYKVTNDTKYYSYIYKATNRKCKTKIGCETTKAQKLEIEFLFDFYKRLYKKEEQFFFETYIQKHRLFGDKYQTEPDEINLDEIARMHVLMQGMTDESPLKQIPKNV